MKDLEYFSSEKEFLICSNSSFRKYGEQIKKIPLYDMKYLEYICPYCSIFHIKTSPSHDEDFLLNENIML